ncbi:MAG: hypothetical protein NC418_05135 [Muribaculaceae bacterium]|nr:hypothetical protein [Muribaculaceae bacterium]
MSEKQSLDTKYKDYRHALIWNGAIHLEPQLSHEEAHSLLSGSSSWMLRNLYDFDCGDETNFWYIIKDSYSESDYSKKVRKYIEKANAKFDIRIISLDRMLNQGFDVYHSAHEHYKVDDGFQLNKDEFLNEIQGMDAGEYEFWGCIDRETDVLQAYCICHVHDGMCWFKYSRANPEFLPKYYPMYGLYDARHKYYLATKQLKYVLTSARSITEHSNIQSFLIEKFGYRKAFCRLKIFYKPWLQFAVSVLYPFRRLIPYRPVKNLLAFEYLNRGNK